DQGSSLAWTRASSADRTAVRRRPGSTCSKAAAISSTSSRRSSTMRTRGSLAAAIADPPSALAVQDRRRVGQDPVQLQVLDGLDELVEPDGLLDVGVDAEVVGPDDVLVALGG